MNQKSVGLTLRALVIALALILAASPGLPLLDGVAYAQSAAPTLTAVNAPGGGVQVSWTAVTGADSYELYKQQEGGSWGAAMSMTATTYTDSNVTAGASYFYIVRAVAAGVPGGWSNTQKVTIPGGTAAPTGQPTLTATASGTTAVALSWTAVSGAATYDLRRWNGSTSSWDAIGGNNLSGTSFTDSGLASGSEYYYVIRAVNAGGNGPWSSENGVGYSSVTLATTTAEPVLTLTHTSREVVDLSWTQVSGTGVEYDLERMTDVSGGAVSDVDWARLPAALLTAREYTDSDAVYVGGSTSTRYHYRVRAVVDGTPGEWSNEVSVPIPVSGSIPAAPSVRVTSADLRSITVEWDTVEDAASYEIRWKVEDGEYTTPRTVSGTSFRHSSLTRETKYTYQVRSKNVNGYSEWSDAASGETASREQSGEGTLAIPSSFRVVSATDKDKDDAVDRLGLKLTWVRVTGATSYQIMAWVAKLTATDGTETDVNQWRVLTQVDDPDADAAVDEIETLTGASTTVTLRGMIAVQNTDNTAAETTYLRLKSDTPYYFVILAEKNENNSMDMSNWSTPVQGMAKALKPDAPTGLKAITTGSTSIWLSWDAPGADVTKNPTGYTISFSSTAGSGHINVKGTTYAHTGLRPGTAYYYRVRATNSNSAPSAWEPSQSSQPTQIKATTAPRDLDMPSGLSAADATGAGDDGNLGTADDVPGIKVSWGKVSGATMYEVQKWTGSAWVSLTTTNKTSYTDMDDGDTDENILMASTPYHYIVRATNGEITSPWSDSVTGLTRGAVYMPTLTLIPTGQTLVRLTWTGVSGATGYELEYQDGNRDAAYFNDDRNDRLELERPGSPGYYVHSGRKPGTRYSYRMRAILPHTKSDWSTVAQVVTRPATPTLTAAKDADTPTTVITLKWDRLSVAGVTAAGGTALGTIDGYQLQQRAATGADTNWGDISGASLVTDTCTATVKCEVSVTGLTTGTKYYFRIRVNLTATELGDPAVPAVTSYWHMATATTD